MPDIQSVRTRYGWQGITELLLAVAVFLLPWQARWIYLPRQLNGGFWEYGSLSLYASELLLWACFTIAVFQVLRRREWQTLPPFSWAKLSSPRGVVFIGTLLLLASAWASGLWAVDRTIALQAAFRLTEAVALFYLVVLQPSAVRRRISIALVLSAAVQALIAISQFFTQAVSGSTWLGVDPQLPSELGASVVELSDGRWLRAYGTFPHPNILAGFLTLGILLGACWYLDSYQRLTRVLALACGMLASIGLALTFSRSGMLAAALGLLVWLVLSALRSRHGLVPSARYAAAVALAFAAAAVLVLPQALARATGVGRLEAKSIAERQQLLGEGWILAKQSFPFGVGIGNATVAAYRVDPSQPGWSYQPVHNLFLLVLLELGVTGLLGLLGVFGGLLWLACGRSRWGSASIITSLIVLGWFDHYLWSLLPGMFMFWVGLGLAQLSSPGEKMS